MTPRDVAILALAAGAVLAFMFADLRLPSSPLERLGIDKQQTPPPPAAAAKTEASA